MKNNRRIKVANPGVLRPPIIYLMSIVSALIIDQFWPVVLPLRQMGPFLGIAILIAGLILFALSKREFRSANTPIAGNRPVTSLIRTGPFRLSRNPIYISFSLAVPVVCLLNILGFSETVCVHSKAHF